MVHLHSGLWAAVPSGVGVLSLPPVVGARLSAPRQPCRAQRTSACSLWVLGLDGYGFNSEVFPRWVYLSTSHCVFVWQASHLHTICSVVAFVLKKLVCTLQLDLLAQMPCVAYLRKTQFQSRR